jgi:hypothetical protein
MRITIRHEREHEIASARSHDATCYTVVNLGTPSTSYGEWLLGIVASSPEYQKAVAVSSLARREAAVGLRALGLNLPAELP